MMTQDDIHLVRSPEIIGNVILEKRTCQGNGYPGRSIDSRYIAKSFILPGVHKSRENPESARGFSTIAFFDFEKQHEIGNAG
jgi:hypothetical protein